MLDRFVGRTIFTDSHAVVGEHPDRLEVAEGGEANGRPHVVGEDEECGAKRHDAAVGSQTVDDGAHAMFADTEVDIATGIVPATTGEALLLGARVDGFPKSPPPLSTVLVDGLRSAEPPMKVGRFL